MALTNSPEEKIRPDPGSLGPAVACAALAAVALRRTWSLID
jgi:hypothetical protein